MSLTPISKEDDNGKDNTPEKQYIFQLEPKYLNVHHELIKIFGKMAHQQQHSASSSQNKGRGGQRGRLQHKKTILVKAKDNWPVCPIGITMQFEDSKDGYDYFKITWNDNYASLQEEFFKCVATHDPNSFQYLLQKSPYHIDSLVQLSEVCKQTGELETAQDFIERAIYAFEASWHHNFNPFSGKCRLSYTHEENRTFFLVLFRYIQLLSRKGFNRTCLEYCKLLLSLDPADPLGVLFIIDYYCLKSNQFEYLLRLYTSEDLSDHYLSTLPNFVFNVALAKFHLENQPDVKLSSNAIKLGSSNELLQYALMLFPMLLEPLVKKAKISVTETDSSGYSKDLSKHGYYATAKSPTSLQPLINIYVERSYSLWQTPEVNLWLKDNVAKVAKRAETNDPMIDNCNTVLQEEYVNNEKSYYNHLLVSEHSDSANVLPPELVQEMRYFGGGARLYEGYNNFQRRQQQQQPTVHATTSNPLMQFVQTLFSRTVPNAPPQNPNDPNWLNNLLQALVQQEEDVNDADIHEHQQ